MPHREYLPRAALGLFTLLLVVVHALLPTGVPANVLYAVVSGMVMGAVRAGLRQHAPVQPRPWRLLALGFALTAAVSVLWVVLEVAGVDPSPLGPLYLLAWAFSLAAAWAMTRSRSRRLELGVVLDVAIVTTGAGILLYVFVVLPTWDATLGSGLQKVIATIYPLLGLAGVAILGRLAFGRSGRLPATWFVAGGLLLLITADLVRALVVLHDHDPGTGPASIRLAGFVLFGAAATHPSMARLSDPEQSPPVGLSRARLLALWTASVAAPVTLLVRAGIGPGGETAVIATGSVALFTLVVARMWGLLGTNMRLLRREHENRFRALVEHAEDVIALVDEDDLITYVSTSVSAAFGYDPEVVLGQGGLPMDGVTGQRLRAALDELRAGDGVRPVRLHGRVRHADGAWRQADAVLVDRRRDPAIGRIVITIRDVTAQRELEQQLTHQAFHDALTGLPNRALFVDRARQSLDVRRVDGTLCAVLFLDLDDFKTVNDSLGHDQGDALLQVIAERLCGVVRGEDTVARLGGDEFAVLMPRAVEPRVVISLAERVLAAVSEPIVLAGRSVTPAASLGIAVSDGHTEVDELLRDADAAMYVAKRQGKGTFRMFDPGMHAHAMHRLQLRTDLFGALERGELFVVYHEIQDLDQGGVAGVEALLRWQHPALGPVPPTEFVPIAEESGRIGDLGVFVLRRACREVQALRADTGSALFLTVNVSPLQLESPGFVDEVSAALVDSGLPAASLVLELTERVLLEESEAVADALARLRATGVRLAIDDFGTGYCSLAYLTRLPFDIIKVDRSFVRMLGDDEADHRVTIGIVELIHSLAVPAVAEGIETDAQLERLRALGCRYGQGFLWGRPVPADQLPLAVATRA